MCLYIRIMYPEVENKIYVAGIPFRFSVHVCVSGSGCIEGSAVYGRLE